MNTRTVLCVLIVSGLTNCSEGMSFSLRQQPPMEQKLPTFLPTGQNNLPECWVKTSPNILVRLPITACTPTNK